jgi:ankyrin repeat protein
MHEIFENIQNLEFDSAFELIKKQPPHMINYIFDKHDNNILQFLVFYMTHAHSKTTTEIFNYILKFPAFEINHQNGDGNTLVHILILGQQQELLNEILKRFRNVKFVPNNNGHTPIHLCCIIKNEDMLRLCIHSIIDSGQDLNLLDIPDSLQKTPLLLAIEQRDEGILECLLKHGADPNDNKINPLHFSIKRRFKKGVLMLIKYGARTNMVDDNKITTKSKFVKTLLK